MRGGGGGTRAFSPRLVCAGTASGVLRRNVLIFHAGALGDFVVSWPLALALGRLHPQLRIIYIAAGQKGKLAEKAIRTESLDIERVGITRCEMVRRFRKAAKTLENGARDLHVRGIAWKMRSTAGPATAGGAARAHRAAAAGGFDVRWAYYAVDDGSTRSCR